MGVVPCVRPLADALLLVALFGSAQGQELYSVECSGDACRPPSKGVAPGATAFGSFEDGIEATGWATLRVGSDLEEDAKGSVAFAAGYLEGYLTAQRVLQMLQNYKANYQLLSGTPAPVSGFLSSNEAWLRKRLSEARAEDPFWGTVRFIYRQLDGLVAGVRGRLGPGSLSYEDALLLNLQGDIDEISLAVNATKRPEFGSMPFAMIERWELTHSHCSALVKLLPDGSDLLTGHNMWWGYYAMLRVFKHYHFPKVLGGRLASASFSSFPGMLASTDDFYQLGSRLVVMETTNNVWNMSLYDSVGPEALFYWVRAMAANYLARNGTEWMDLFRRYNSGTYNNMWMVIDYNLFTPRAPLPAGLLTVGEQLPGYFHFEDQTGVLAYGYWPSYNRALYPETVRLSGQDAMEAAQGSYYGYQLTARAKIFRRDQGAVHSEADMKHILRYNEFKKDPLSEGKPCWTLACRGDLKQLPDTVGAIDAKLTTMERVLKGETEVVSGPTTDGQPVFDWSTVPEELKKISHVGQPQRFDFGWVTMRFSPDDPPSGRSGHGNVVIYS